ncbi:hypothetical protein ACFSC4_15010 [Deinococcus malanensis]|uniref:hypothetical protein n=1 Tax=Deinococcus malanensis TaxID=1706855 RepID=UPI0036252691
MTSQTTPESEVLRRATRALLQRDPEAFDAVCAPYFQGQAPRLLAALDEERPSEDEEFAFPTRYVMHLDNLEASSRRSCTTSGTISARERFIRCT